MIEKFRPLTPPCVPFGTRRFNQLNKYHTFRCSSLTLRLGLSHFLFFDVHKKSFLETSEEILYLR